MLPAPIMPPRLLRRVVLATALALAFIVCLPAIARAADISVSLEASLPRLDKDGNGLNKRSSALNPEAVNLQDCIDDQKIRFPVVLSNFEVNASLQVWAGLAGADCTKQEYRSGSNATCWQLSTGLPLQSTQNVDLPVRAIMAGAPPYKPQALGTNDAMCGQVDLATISVQFLYFSPGQLATSSANHSVSVTVDTVGPLPPSGIKTLPGNTRIAVRWDNISGEGGVSNVTGIKVYCDPAIFSSAGSTSTTDATTNATTDASCTEVPNETDGGDGGDDDAGTTVVCDGGTDDAGISSSSSGPVCTSPNLAPTSGTKIVPDANFDAKYKCGEIAGNSGIQATATSIAGVPLENNKSYAVAIAATDAYGNLGPLSAVYCETPEVTNSFWENYVNAGGGAGGGLCTASGPEAPIGSLTTFAVIALAAATSLRRRRNRR